jgi:UDP-3-O-[3-hydroxymyristoyl] glucosamine N-acyltransferase
MKPFLRALPRAVSAAELARGLPPTVIVDGDGARMIRRIAALSAATDGALAFCDATQPDDALTRTSASVIVVTSSCPAAPGPTRTFLRVDDVRACFIRAVALLLPDCARPQEPGPGVDATACIDATARISPLAAIGARVRIGAGTRVGPGAVVYADCVIGAECVIGPNAAIGWVGLAYHDGADGRRMFFPHLGSVCVGDRVDIGANACICRGMLSDTRIGDQAKLGSLVYVGHGCDVAANTWLSAGTALAGHSSTGAHALVGIGTVVVDNVTVGANALLGAGSVVTKGVADGEARFGNPARPVAKARRFGPTPRD